jgi:hypothetical protein
MCRREGHMLIYCCWQKKVHTCNDIMTDPPSLGTWFCIVYLCAMDKVNTQTIVIAIVIYDVTFCLMAKPGTLFRLWLKGF